MIKQSFFTKKPVIKFFLYFSIPRILYLPTILSVKRHKPSKKIKNQ